MTKYSRVSYAQRCHIDALLQAKLSIPEIATRLGVHKSTIYRELKRNAIHGIYTPIQAHRRSLISFARCRRKTKISGKLETIVNEKLVLGWSPEQIAGRLKQENKLCISHEAVYRYIRNNPHLRVYLRFYQKRGGGRYKQKKLFQHRSTLKIKDRPKIINERLRIGDWERDTFFTKNNRHMLVMTDRRSRLTLISRLENQKAQTMANHTLKLIKRSKKKAYSLTNDNGPEFKKHIEIGINVYYCDPLKPQQRGTVENSIGLLRKYFPRNIDINEKSYSEIRMVEDLLNKRPRKVLDYKTPYEVFYNKRVALVT